MTLTQTAIIARRSILGFIIFTVLGLTSFIGYKIWHASYIASLPPVEEKPDTKFGILPQPNFPSSKILSSNFSYSLDTTTGGLPQFGKIVKVYFMPKASATFLAAQKSQALAEKFKITNPPQVISETKHNFQQDNRNLTVELDTGNFVYSSNASPSGQPLDNDSKLTSDFKNLLSLLGILKEGLSTDKVKINLLKYDGSQFTGASSRNEALAAQIYLWPTDIDKLPIVTSQFNVSYVGAEIIDSARNLENIRSLNFTFWPIDLSTSASYPAKPVEVAFEELKSGEGIIVVEPGTGPVSITSVYLAYYQGSSYTPYLQPVFVFEGPGFVAYVSTLTKEFLSK